MFVLAMAATIVGLVSSLPVGAETTSSANITVLTEPTQDQPDCKPVASKDATASVYSSATSFVLTIQAKAPICDAVTAAIYSMPNNIFWPWPQQKVETVTFQVPAGKTTVTFTKGCSPQQFDVVTGDTPDRIQPTTGPMHGPLLFTVNPYSATQHFPTSPCTGGTTTTTVPGATTTTVLSSTTLAVTTTTAVSPTSVAEATTTIPGTTSAVSPTSVAGVTTTQVADVQPETQDRDVSGSGLPNTGFAGQSLLVLGACLLVAGGIAVRISAIRRRA